MKDLREHFLSESANKITQLLANLASCEVVPDSLRREVFRTLHTIKGTSETFGYKASGRLANDLESMLTEGFSPTNAVFLEGLKNLQQTLTKNDFEIPEDFVQKIARLHTSKITRYPKNSFSSDLPVEYHTLLSEPEKANLRSQIDLFKNLVIFETVFAKKHFAAELRQFRQIVNESGEIIATFPNPNAAHSEKIGFLILAASFENAEFYDHLIEKFGAKIIFESSSKVLTNDVQGVLTMVVSHGKRVAESVGKKIQFEVEGERESIFEKHLKLIFDSLLHLVRNAVDHAFEKAGKIEISVNSAKNGVILRVSDNGCGIDLARIRQIAIERNLIDPKKEISDETTLSLIFESEFSTAPEITEISGRGVGLDAVKNAVENANGTITVNSKINDGTTFEIFLPND